MSLSKTIEQLNSPDQINDFIKSLFTPDEISEFENRLHIIKLLQQKKSQRFIANKLNVGIATVSRGANELKKGRFKFLKNIK